jgi:hypothetical protein
MSERILNHVNNRPPPGAMSGQMTIQDLMGIYGFLNNIPNPTEKISQAKDNLESIILEFSRSLTGQPPR